MTPASPLIVLIAGLLGCVWFALEGAPLPFAFFAFVLAVGAYELHATLAHESGEEFEG